jgi:hypothetical protein
LVDLSAQIEDLSRLTAWFRSHAIPGKNLDATATPDLLATQWLQAFTNATAIEEVLREPLVAAGEEYDYKERKLLDEAERALLEQRRRTATHRVYP